MDTLLEDVAHHVLLPLCHNMVTLNMLAHTSKAWQARAVRYRRSCYSTDGLSWPRDFFAVYTRALLDWYGLGLVRALLRILGPNLRPLALAPFIEARASLDDAALMADVVNVACLRLVPSGDEFMLPWTQALFYTGRFACMLPLAKSSSFKTWVPLALASNRVAAWQWLEEHSAHPPGCVCLFTEMAMEHWRELVQAAPAILDYVLTSYAANDLFWITAWRKVGQMSHAEPQWTHLASKCPLFAQVYCPALLQSHFPRSCDGTQSFRAWVLHYGVAEQHVPRQLLTDARQNGHRGYGVALDQCDCGFCNACNKKTA